jgi:large subunit ribosomal protein L23
VQIKINLKKNIEKIFKVNVTKINIINKKKQIKKLLEEKSKSIWFQKSNNNT